MLIDSHVHTNVSPDSQAYPKEIVTNCKQSRLDGVIFTNHFECYNDERKHMPFSYIVNTCRQAEEMRLLFPDAYIGAGIELGQPNLRPEIEKDVLSLPLDCITASLHKLDDIDVSRFPFDEHNTRDYLIRYYRQLIRIAQEAEYDVLAHFDLPARYIPSDILAYDTGLYILIDENFSTLIHRKKSLEVNTSIFFLEKRKSLSSVSLLSRYYMLGGRYITLGSDAHFAKDVGRGFDLVLPILKEIGFDEVGWYQKRQRCSARLAEIKPDGR